MSVEFDRESPGKIDSRTLNRKTLSRWTGRKQNLPRASVYRYMRGKIAGGTVSLNSRFQTVLFQQCSANLSPPPFGAPRFDRWNS